MRNTLIINNPNQQFSTAYPWLPTSYHYTENMNPKKNLIGQTFWLLKVTWFALSAKSWKAKFKVLCECWTKKEVTWDNLRRWRTRSCGCKLPNYLKPDYVKPSWDTEKDWK